MKQSGRFGDFGGAYVPQILVPALEELEAVFLASREDAAFQQELGQLLTHYAGRPTSLYKCRNLCAELPSSVFLKREDLVHGGAHKTNQVLAQGLLARRVGKTRLIAETGAGQHGVATAMAGALLGMETEIYMGAKDVARQQPNVYRMKLMGARVIAVEQGARTLKDAINEALRDWAANFSNTHYVLGTVAGPHPYPLMVREFQRVIGAEARRQFLASQGRLPDAVLACVGGGSNAMGIFADFIDDPAVRLIGVEAAGHGLHTTEHCASLQLGDPGVLHGSYTKILQDEDGQVLESHSIAAGLDYPGVGPEHAHLQAIGRAEYVGVGDEEALATFRLLSRVEGIIPALESSHALAYAIRMARQSSDPLMLLVNLSGRGDKDLGQVAAMDGVTGLIT